MSETTRQPTLDVRNVSKSFDLPGGGLFRRNSFQALSDVSFSLQRGEAFGLVGESGSGKSTIGRIILQLLRADAGEIVFEGEPLGKADPAKMKLVRRRMQAIFQDPYAALNPRMRVGTFIAEPLRVHGIGSRSERDDKVAALLREVGLDPAVRDRFPHEFSGGQRQRICIARALALQPSLIVADEPVTALDVSIQAQIINLMQDMQDSHGLAYVFIAHDLNIVRHMCRRAAVMFRGRIVEMGSVESIFGNPQHPYTRTLIAALPTVGTGRRAEGTPQAGSIPAPAADAQLVPCGPNHFVLK